MRNIKFRVWNTLEKEMEIIDDLYWFADYRCHHNGDNNYIIQQYTGLKDKNGVEIYEGDTLRSCRKRPKENSEYCLGDYWMEDGSDPFEEVVELFTIVAHETQFFERKYQDGRGGLLNGSDFNTCEVIGNVFEGVDK